MLWLVHLHSHSSFGRHDFDVAGNANEPKVLSELAEGVNVKPAH